MRAPASGEPEEVTPDAVSARSRVHEYGGGAFRAEGDTLFYTALDDQALWRLDPDRSVTRLTPLHQRDEANRDEASRYADTRLTAEGRWLVALRERHHRSGVADEVVAVDAWGEMDPAVVVDGRDFFAAPRPAPDGTLLAWLTWDHPQMPWDGCELWVGTLRLPHSGSTAPAAPPEVVDRQLVAGGPEESVGQPTWGPDGALWFVSDRHGWWQPFRADPAGGSERMCAEEAEFHSPDWVLGQATLDFLDDGALVCRVRREGRDRVGVLDPGTGRLHEVAQPYTAIGGLQVMGDDIVVVGSTERDPPGVGLVRRMPARRVPARRAPVALRRPAPRVVPPGSVSVPEPMTFPTAGGARSHLLFHPPVGDGVEGPPGVPPPLVVLCHGGPTAAVDAAFDPAVQLWTTRGLAVANVDYRGSAGHGRAYRRLLDGSWGVADAEDCAAAAAHLAETGRVDGTRMVVKGSSAGGFTALRALVPGGPFAAAVVAYPVTDLRAIAADTHKFEARYLDRLVGPWPEAAATYEERSPALHPERIGGAVLLLQGEDDPVVPPDQAARLAEALRARGVRCDHVVFAGEGHGFRRADTLVEAARLELAFVGEVLGFQPVF
jgi:dipeptidyl aminopeptidase/acylaminoacyl peptidase